MINANELRLGNYLSWNPQLTNSKTTLQPLRVEVAAVLADSISYLSPRVDQRVEPFEDDVVEADSPTAPLGEFEPIPLTPEILKNNCGFVADSEHCYSNRDLVRQSNFTVQPFRVFCFPNESQYTEDGLHRSFRPFHSLHQLQNLYFALTGEELKISFS